MNPKGTDPCVLIFKVGFIRILVSQRPTELFIISNQSWLFVFSISSEFCVVWCHYWRWSWSRMSKMLCIQLSSEYLSSQGLFNVLIFPFLSPTCVKINLAFSHSFNLKSMLILLDKNTSYIHWFINPLIPNSDRHLISPYSITTWLNTQVMRIKEMNTNYQMSWFLIKFSQLVAIWNMRRIWMLILEFKGLILL